MVYQDTDAGPWDKGASGSQTTFNNGRAVSPPPPRCATSCSTSRPAAGGEPRRPRARRGPRARQGLARPGRRDRRARRGAARFSARAAASTPQQPAAPTMDGCAGRLGHESFLAPQVFTHAARVRVDRDTGVVRVSSRRRPRLGRDPEPPGADGQVYGGVTMGIGQALLERTQLRPRVATATRTCSTTSSSPPPTHPRSPSRGSRHRPRAPGRTAPRASARLRAFRPAAPSAMPSQPPSAEPSRSCR